MSEQVRGYIYRVLTAVGVVLVFYGVISQDELALWLGVAVNLLQTAGNALASVNTSIKTVAAPPVEE